MGSAAQTPSAFERRARLLPSGVEFRFSIGWAPANSAGDRLIRYAACCAEGGWLPLLSEFYVADEMVADFGMVDGPSAEDRCDTSRISFLEAAAMLAALRGDDDRSGAMNEFEMVSPQDGEEWTFSVPSEFVDRLRALQDSELEDVAARFSDATAAELSWSAEVFQPVVISLRSLAVRAADSGRRMFLWNGL